jgi:hypothetical protein
MGQANHGGWHSDGIGEISRAIPDNQTLFQQSQSLDTIFGHSMSLSATEWVI